MPTVSRHDPGNTLRKLLITFSFFPVEHSEKNQLITKEKIVRSVPVRNLRIREQ
jgi:hypothetical protein